MVILRGCVGAAALVVGLLAAGCARQQGTVGTLTTSAAAASPNGPSQASRLARLKDCSAVSYEDKSVDCVVKSSDKTKRTLEVTGAGPYTVGVFDASGAPQQTLPPLKDDGGHFGLAEFKDLDGDGLDEVLVPFGGGGSSGAQSFEVWRASGPAARFADAGRIDGHGEFRRTSDGKFFGDYGYGGAGSAVFNFYRFVDDKVVEVLTLDVHVQHDDATSEISGVTCGLGEDDYPEGSRAKRDAALKAAGLDPVTAERTYCAEPWVRSVFTS